MARDRIPETVPLLRLSSSGGLGGTLLRVATLVGAVAFAVTLLRDPSLAWKSYVVSWSYFTSIAAGGVAVAVVTWIVKAKWNWPVRRIHQSFSAFLPFSFVLFLPMLVFLREDYFPWIGMMADDAIVQKKQAWLNIPFLVSRNGTECANHRNPPRLLEVQPVRMPSRCPGLRQRSKPVRPRTRRTTRPSTPGDMRRANESWAIRR